MSKLIKQIASVALLALLLFLLFVALSRGQSLDELVTSAEQNTLQKTVVASGGMEKQISRIGENGITGNPSRATYRRRGIRPLGRLLDS